MNITMKRLSATMVAAALLLGASACSNDEKAKDAPVETKAGDAPVENDGSGGQGPGDPAGNPGEGLDVGDALGAGEALDAIGPEGVASAMVTATGAERYEMQGDVVHLYLSPEGTINNAEMACMVANAVINEGDEVVIHDAEGETAC